MKELNLHFTLMQAIPPEVGKSLYQMWLELGHTGTVQDFINSLQSQGGQDGKDGQDGLNGQNGQDGATGSVGPVGPAGPTGEAGVGMSESQTLALSFMQDFISNAFQVQFAAPSNVTINSYVNSAGLSSMFSSNVVAQLTWDFGDGQTGVGQSPQHTYAQPGTYTVTVEASNVYGRCSSQTEVTVVSPLSILSVGGAATVNQAYQLMSQSQIELNGRVWDFGDGQTASGERVSVTYPTVGRYQVSVTGQNAQGEPVTAMQWLDVGEAVNPLDQIMDVQADWVSDNGHVENMGAAVAFSPWREDFDHCFYSNGQAVTEVVVSWPSARVVSGFALKQLQTWASAAVWQLWGSNDAGTTWTALAPSVYLGEQSAQCSRGADVVQPYLMHKLQALTANNNVTLAQVTFYTPSVMFV